MHTPHFSIKNWKQMNKCSPALKGFGIPSPPVLSLWDEKEWKLVFEKTYVPDIVPGTI